MSKIIKFARSINIKKRVNIKTIFKPLGFIYGLVTGFRNLLYDFGLIRGRSFDVPVISIGNITVGGTGKTPHTEYIIRLLQDKFRIAVLSRGYGRKSKGFVSYTPGTPATIIGDEPFQIANKFPDIRVAVDEKRAHGINALLNSERYDAILLDDAFQHRKVTPSLNILLVDYNRNIMDDYMLPAGRLREWAYNRKRADIIIVTKCPKEISQREREELSGRLCVSESQRIFFTTIKYGVPYSINNDKELINLEQLSVDSSILLLSGIASPQQMYSHIRQFTDNIEMLTFGDHHNYTLSDIYSLKLKLSKISATRKFILTTEKDAARLREMNLEEDLRKFIYVLPIEMSFINDGTIFDNCIIEHLNR